MQNPNHKIPLFTVINVSRTNYAPKNGNENLYHIVIELINSKISNNSFLNNASLHSRMIGGDNNNNNNINFDKKQFIMSNDNHARNGRSDSNLNGNTLSILEKNSSEIIASSENIVNINLFYFYFYILL
jgi:hypothetical protein